MRLDEGQQLLCVFWLVVHTGQHAVLEGDEVARRGRQVTQAGVEQLGNRVFAVQRHQGVAQGIVGRVQ
ncbi:hypothetical protein D9M68_852690 [compost metagenome]